MLARMDPLLFALSLCAAFCFGLGLVLTRRGLFEMTPIQGASMSVPTTAAVLLLIAPATVDLAHWNTHAVLLFVAAGLIFPAAVTLLTFAANRRIGPNLTGALGNVSPAFAVAIAAVLLGERPTLIQLAGLTAVCVGGMMLFGGRKTSLPGVPLWAFLLPVAAALVRGLAQPMVKLGLIDWPNPFAATTVAYLVSACVILGIAASRGVPPRLPRRRADLWFVAVGLANGGALLALYSALTLGPVKLVAPVVACYPLVTLALNRVILADRALGAWLLAGILVTVAGVVLLVAS